MFVFVHLFPHVTLANPPLIDPDTGILLRDAEPRLHGLEAQAFEDWECGVLRGDSGAVRNGPGDVVAWCEDV